MRDASTGMSPQEEEVEEEEEEEADEEEYVYRIARSCP